MTLLFEKSIPMPSLAKRLIAKPRIVLPLEPVKSHRPLVIAAEPAPFSSISGGPLYPGVP